MRSRLRKGDTVVVITGDDKGRTGRVLAVDEAKQRVIVERVNMIKRHTKSRRAGMQSGIIEREAPVHISNVMLWDAKAGRGARVGSRRLPDGRRERISRASGEVLGKSE
jgi:large subunit ribosomal protein L24